jgi:DEAD/DEAH box helicase domain-containing protein
MLPSLLAREVQTGLKQFLTVGFEPLEALFAGVMERFTEQESRWMKGPYVQLGLPFHVGSKGRKFFKGFETECFLYPLLDHCVRSNAAGVTGIKALVIYPMNALATDQARRFAEVIADLQTMRDDPPDIIQIAGQRPRPSGIFARTSMRP